MVQHETVLFANDAFYVAFQNRDMEAMEAIWAEHAAVSCIHPGWPALLGRDEVLESWQSILTSDNAPDIRCRAPWATIYGNAATVICYEEISDSYLIATNVFVLEGGRWKMVHHQAAPTSGVPGEDPDDERETVN